MTGLLRRMRAAVATGRERGSSALEVTGLMGVVVLLLLLGLQVGAAVYTTQAANQAVRDGARALSLGDDAAQAVERSLPGSLTARSVTYPGAGAVRIEVVVPSLKVLPELVVSREAVMP